MTTPLVACLAIALAFTASAQTAPLKPQEFKDALTRDFAKGRDLSNMNAAGQAQPITQLLDQAKYIQLGREPGDEKETYITFIRSVARRLGTRSDLAVLLYANRERPARTAAAQQSELDVRAAIALDVKRNPGISEAKKKRIGDDLRTTGDRLMRFQTDDADFLANSQGRQLIRPHEITAIIPDALPPGAEELAAKRSRDLSDIPPQVQPYPYLANIAPPPAAPLQSASAGMMSWANLTSYFDWEKGKQVAREAYTGTLSYTKEIGAKCYRFFKQALIDAGVIDAPNPQSTGLVGLRPAAAKMFSQDVQKRPKILDEMGYRQVDLANASNDPASVPDGSLLIYAGSCSFADPTSGHAEITVGERTYSDLRTKNARLRALPVTATELRVCHFSCTTRSMPFLRTYGKKGCLKMYVPVKA